MRRRFVESKGFSTDRRRLEKAGELTVEDLVAVEQEILTDPEKGDLVVGTGGLRKIRVGQKQLRRGKSGGVRIYYLDLPRAEVTHLLAIFGKREKDDLSVDERKALRAFVAAIKEESKS